MTRKDYRLIATAIVAALASCPSEEQRKGVVITARLLAADLKADNPRFCVGTFYNACGLGDN